jgi:hypothetical protein
LQEDLRVHVDVYRTMILDHARKLGYGEPEVVENFHWKFKTPCGVIVFVLYAEPPGWDVVWATHYRQAQRYLTMKLNKMRSLGNRAVK